MPAATVYRSPGAFPNCRAIITARGPMSAVRHASPRRARRSSSTRRAYGSGGTKGSAAAAAVVVVAAAARGGVKAHGGADCLPCRTLPRSPPLLPSSPMTLLSLLLLDEPSNKDALEQTAPVVKGNDTTATEVATDPRYPIAMNRLVRLRRRLVTEWVWMDIIRGWRSYVMGKTKMKLFLASSGQVDNLYHRFARPGSNRPAPYFSSLTQSHQPYRRRTSVVYKSVSSTNLSHDAFSLQNIHIHPF